MSIASIILAQSQVALDAVHGESVTFRGATVTASVDRRDNYQFKEQTDAPRGDETMVRILNSALAALTPTTPPSKGEFFQDAYGDRSMIARVKRIDEHWCCTCGKFTP